VGAKVWITIGVEFLIFALLLFASAGTIMWLAGWGFIVLFFSGAIAITLMLSKHDPALLKERMKPLIQRDQPLWDKILLVIALIFWLGWLVLMGLDAVRFRWSMMPIWLQMTGAAGLLFSLWICYRTFQENSFSVTVVKIQRERGQRVVSSGPYSVVRHPLYAAVLILLPSTAFTLGSWYGLIASFAIIAVIVIRTVLEDRTLMRELGGYADYAAKVRYRLIPYIW
jgi:protein-S-isoprenylcysteine O-methyltransferase Ste14